ncbi:Strictosidine synthase 1 [Hordeum vulgare]|nr:Strictosidine synthase 1 [Hordeum vulgare]
MYCPHGRVGNFFIRYKTGKRSTRSTESVEREEWTVVDIASLQEDDSDDQAYKGSLRELEGDLREYAPLMNIVASEVNIKKFDGSDALCYEPGMKESNT